MLARLARYRPTPAMLVALLALFVALGGTTYAVTVPRASVGPAQLRAGAVSTSKIARRAVIRDKLGIGVVGTDQIGTNVITSIKIAPGAIGNAQLQTNAVSGSKIGSGAVSNSKLGTGSVSNAKLGSSSVSTSKIQSGSIAASKLKKIVVREQSVTVPGNTADGHYLTRQVSANCASNERAIGIGTKWSSDATDDEELATVSSRFTTDGSGNPNGATARGASDQSTDRTFYVQVSCLQE